MALRSGEVDWVLAGAVSAADPFFIHAGFLCCKHTLKVPRPAPPRSKLKGLYASEGVGMVLLRRLEDARSQKNPILGLFEEVAGRMMAKESLY